MIKLELLLQLPGLRADRSRLPGGRSENTAILARMAKPKHISVTVRARRALSSQKMVAIRFISALFEQGLAAYGQCGKIVFDSRTAASQVKSRPSLA
jgi:hypothetical protein